MDICINEIDKILDKYLEEHEKGDDSFRNVLFLGNDDDMLISETIGKWLKTHIDQINLFQDPYVQKLYYENEEGIFSPKTPEVWTIGDVHQLNRKNSVLYFSALNWALGTERDDIILNLICKRQFKNLYNEQVYFNNAFLCIMEAQQQNRPNSSLPNVPEEILNSADVYNVIQ